MKNSCGQEKNGVQIPSTAASDTQQFTAGHKRKRSPLYHNDNDKKPKTSQQTLEGVDFNTHNPVAYWASTQNWPPNFSQRNGNAMPESSSKRKSESAHRHRSSRLANMQEHRIFMSASKLIDEASKSLSKELLQGDLAPVSFPVFPAARVFDVIARVESANENRIQRDVMPVVVPSAENLRFCGVPGLDSVVEELSALWTRCAPMGSAIPKPDYVAGLASEAFSRDKLEPLRNYATLETPFLFTHNLGFPFLICEAKNGDEGLNKAHRQNIHSAAIAVKAIHELHWAAYGKNDQRAKELHGKILVFTIAHDHEMVHIYGHFALPAVAMPDVLAFHRCQIGVFSLTTLDGRDLNKPQNFVRNVYDKFVPQHLKRIKEAAKNLPPQEPRTGASFAFSMQSLNNADYSVTETQDDGSSQIPAEYVRAMQIRETQLTQQLGTLLERMQQQERVGAAEERGDGAAEERVGSAEEGGNGAAKEAVGAAEEGGAGAAEEGVGAAEKGGDGAAEERDGGIESLIEILARKVLRPVTKNAVLRGWGRKRARKNELLLHLLHILVFIFGKLLPYTPSFHLLLAYTPTYRRIPLGHGLAYPVPSPTVPSCYNPLFDQ